ncbi:hypothetical protein DFQ27_002616 [Actinomortierella ambigua]|uniref:Uncharacterized protein n=1 Tax=Actinomortierella ambigua TaxID=1343610 RepID=A0A9P6UD91_9FUNG|nr:hypothetical protein DFQ27_002616 [Actinomortierella ambigua]
MRGNLCSDIKRTLDKVAMVQPREEPIWVENAFAHLRISVDHAATKNTVETIIGEPFVFQAVYSFIEKEDKKTKDSTLSFREQRRDLQDPSSEGEIFERHALLDLTHVFRNTKLKRELFSTPKSAMRF